MTEQQLVNAQGVWRDKPFEYGEGTIYQTVAAVVDMWTWAADEPAYAALPRPPYNLERVMPRPPIYEAPQAVPTWEECGAVVRRVRMPKAFGLVIIMRYTGLRLQQAAHVYAEDLDPTTETLLIREGKSRREQALMRRVPVSSHLFRDIGPWVRETPVGPLFPDHRRVDAEGRPLPMRGYRNQTRYVTEAWKAATEANEARLEAWSPPNRKKNRPDHAFRASFQAAIEGAGYSQRLADWLVGHKDKTTRGQHYVSPDEGVLRKAVAVVPAIDWGEARGNVVEFG